MTAVATVAATDAVYIPLLFLAMLTTFTLSEGGLQRVHKNTTRKLLAELYVRLSVMGTNYLTSSYNYFLTTSLKK